MSWKLSGKRALVCGASQGIGRAVAEELAGAGAQLILLARDAQALKGLASTLPGGPHLTVACDLADTDGLRRELTALATEPIDILVCNAGGPPSGPLLEAQPETFLSAFRIHVIANQVLASTLVPGMKAKGYGRIINIISTSVKVPLPNLGVSNTIRGAVASWAKSLANELGPHGITVNNVLPGYTQTQRLQALMKAAADRTHKSTDDIAAEWKNSVPARRFADPRETAQAVAFLASPMASYINGVNLPVDGGRTGSL